MVLTLAWEEELSRVLLLLAELPTSFDEPPVGGGRPGPILDEAIKTPDIGITYNIII